jgi:xanthosine utilization system XapX-like protein
MDFYDEVLRELFIAIGAALFVGNLFALLRRRAPAPANQSEDGHGLARAPIGRTLVYMALGLVMAFWGLASLLAG